MFSVHCPRHNHDVLLSERRITGLVSSESRITVRWVCWCGYQGSHHTGRGRRTAEHLARHVRPARRRTA